MAKIPECYSVKETKKPIKKRIYRDDDQCRAGRDIPQSERHTGTGGYKHCQECIEAYLASAFKAFLVPFLVIPSPLHGKIVALQVGTTMGTKFEDGLGNRLFTAAAVNSGQMSTNAYSRQLS
ncbi:MAG: hypothetical protein ABSA27_00090 [Terriglobales bacterium]|jgi:hypothetical protein